jgi:hypothetical protein
VIFIDLFFPITKEEATIAVSAITTLCVIIATSGLHNFLQAVWEGMNGNGNGNGNGGENV